MTTKILDVDTNDIKQKLIVAMTKMASQGSVPAAQAAMKMIEDLEISDASRIHNEKLEEYKSVPIKLCEYLGRIGESKSELERYLKRPPSNLDIKAYKEGGKSRRLEVRAIELELAKRGGKISDWMKR